MLTRLHELETGTLDRRTRAEAGSRAGEIEGIDMTLTFPRAKRDDTQRRLRRPVAGLGITSTEEVGEHVLRRGLPKTAGQGWSQRSNQARVRRRMSSWWLRSWSMWPSLG